MGKKKKNVPTDWRKPSGGGQNRQGGGWSRKGKSVGGVLIFPVVKKEKRGGIIGLTRGHGRKKNTEKYSRVIKRGGKGINKGEKQKGSPIRI